MAPETEAPATGKVSGLNPVEQLGGRLNNTDSGSGLHPQDLARSVFGRGYVVVHEPISGRFRTPPSRPDPIMEGAGMNAHVKPAALLDANSRRDFVLAALRSTCMRVKLIDNELAMIGTALKGGFISPETALEWAEDVAPGCVSYIPDAITAEGAIV